MNKSFSIETALEHRALVSSLGLVLIAVGFVTYRLYWHPLARFPGPKSWAITRVPWIRHIMKGRMWHELEYLHEKFGPIVRIAPDELSICSAPAWPDIYTVRPLLPKEPSSQTPPLNGAHSLFTAVGDDHTRLRGILAAGFSDKALRDQGSHIEHYADELIARLRRELQDGPVLDIQRFIGYAVMDTITDLSYGESMDGLSGRNEHGWIARFFMHGRFSTVRMCMCWFYPLDRLLDMIVLRLTRKQRAKNWAIFSSKIERRMNRDNTKGERSDLMTFVIGRVVDDEAKDTVFGVPGKTKVKSLTRSELLSHSLASVVANSQLTTVTLTTCLYFLLQNKQALDRAISEVRQEFKSDKDISIQSSLVLKYLDAVINETMRIHHPTPINLPRVIPPEGRTIDGTFIPGNTIVGINLHVVQTTPTYWVEPNVFHPERFLPQSDSMYDHKFDKDVKAAYMPFSTGPRNCIGAKLFLAEARVTLAKLLWNFDFSMSDNQAGNWLEGQVAYIVYEPKSLIITMREREGQS